jgi:hypothetical protein
VEGRGRRKEGRQERKGRRAGGQTARSCVVLADTFLSHQGVVGSCYIFHLTLCLLPKLQEPSAQEESSRGMISVSKYSLKK